MVFNPLMPSGVVHPYQLDLSIFSFRDVWCIFYFIFFFVFRIEIIVCKQYRPWLDTAFCGVWSGTALFVYVSKIVRKAWKERVYHSDSAGINQKKWRICRSSETWPSSVGRTWLLTYWWDTKLFKNVNNNNKTKKKKKKKCRKQLLCT